MLDTNGSAVEQILIRILDIDAAKQVLHRCWLAEQMLRQCGIMMKSCMRLETHMPGLKYAIKQTGHRALSPMSKFVTATAEDSLPAHAYKTGMHVMNAIPHAPCILQGSIMLW